MEEMKILTVEDYNKYKSNDEFLHNVAFAHGVQGWEDSNKALCHYSVGSDFKVSSKIQEIAKNDYQKRKDDIIKNIKVNELVFVGVGMDFKPIGDEYIGNHRIRTYFKDNDGCLCFVEFGACCNKEFLRCDHALKNTKKPSLNLKILKEKANTEERVYALEKISSLTTNLRYTKQNILKLVNKHFNTNFKDVKIFSYFLSTEDYTSISHKN